MRFVTAFRLLMLLAFALFGGALPVAASSDHIVICGADGEKRIVAFDFETGIPIDVEIAKPVCQDCFGVTPLLIAAPGVVSTAGPASADWLVAAAASASKIASANLPPARGPPALII